MSVESEPLSPKLRRRVLLLVALFTLAQILGGAWFFQGQRAALGQFMERGTMLLEKAKVAVVAAASTVLAACVGLTGSVRADDKDWLEKCPTPRTRKAAMELELHPTTVGHAYLEECPNVRIERSRGAEVRAGPVEVPVTISTPVEGIGGLLFGDIRTGSDGASFRFTRFKRDRDGREFPVCAIASMGGYGDPPGIPKVKTPDPEPHPGFMVVYTGQLQIYFAQ